MTPEGRDASGHVPGCTNIWHNPATSPCTTDTPGLPPWGAPEDPPPWGTPEPERFEGRTAEEWAHLALQTHAEHVLLALPDIAARVLAPGRVTRESVAKALDEIERELLATVNPDEGTSS
jgi:hypothetical protein